MSDVTSRADANKQMACHTSHAMLNMPNLIYCLIKNVYTRRTRICQESLRKKCLDFAQTIFG